MNQRYFEDRIMLYIDGDLPPDERTRYEEYLRTHPRYRERVDALRQAWNSDNLLNVTGPTLRLRTRFEAALRGEDIIETGPTVGTRIAWLARPALMAVTLVAGILIGTYLGSGTNGDMAGIEPLPVQTGVVAYSFANDLQEISSEPVEQEFLLLDWVETGDDTGR
ncbi:MAG: hypothetical protein F4X08_04015 [Gemmatimonadetes bacterium]|nr:hypothetical protein [Gemmatimonadota bacterium]MYD24964.1 hypothetical protein [Gemmatimonadota bacterium]MYI98349.1 hypothetical protein [Gemmatimonadota bacterium]